MEATEIRVRRLAVGISQAELARRAGTSQPAIAAYECGARRPGPDTLSRIERSLVRPSEVLRTRRDAVLARVARLADRVRVFGSVARGDDRFDSDIDLLIDFRPGVSTWDQAELLLDLQELLAPVSVDQVSSSALRPRHSHILREARDL